MNLQHMLASIPYLMPHEIAVENGPDGAIHARMPFRAEITNYIGTVHAGALFTLAETAAGIAATLIIPGGRALVLLRGATVRFTRRANSDLVASANVPADSAAKSRNAFATQGRADSRVPARIIDAEGASVFEADFDYALRQVTT